MKNDLLLSIFFMLFSSTLTAQVHYSCNKLQSLDHSGMANETKIRFVNEGNQTIEIFWVKGDGEQIKYYELRGGQDYIQGTYTSHYWVAKTKEGGHCLGVYINRSTTQADVLVSMIKEDQPLPPEPVEGHKQQQVEEQKPPYWGTIFVDPDIIKDSDPNCFRTIVASGQGKRTMYDRRVEKFVERVPFLFTATYADGYTIEVQVNPEFGSHARAMPDARKYARAIGFLPAELRKDIQTMWIHKGDKLFGGGNNNILIHTEQGVKYEKDGILEETLVHEASHTSLDAYHAKAPAWVAAQKADGIAISTYAKDHPEREDIAETYLLYFALKYRPDRISEEMKKTIRQTIPNRINYFESQSFKMFPVVNGND